MKLRIEEQKLIESVEQGEWQSILTPSRNNQIKKCEASTLKKTQRINLRLSSNDLEHVKMTAVNEGMPYQTLISSIIHKFVTGQIRETKRGI